MTHKVTIELDKQYLNYVELVKLVDPSRNYWGNNHMHNINNSSTDYSLTFIGSDVNIINYSKGKLQIQMTELGKIAIGNGNVKWDKIIKRIIIESNYMDTFESDLPEEVLV